MGESLTSASMMHYAKSINRASTILCESMLPIVTQQSAWHLFSTRVSQLVVHPRILREQLV
jgi:hypothetical protein